MVCHSYPCKQMDIVLLHADLFRNQLLHGQEVDEHRSYRKVSHVNIVNRVTHKCIRLKPTLVRLLSAISLLTSVPSQSLRPINWFRLDALLA